jgi:hypothetical protein
VIKVELVIIAGFVATLLMIENLITRQSTRRRKKYAPILPALRNPAVPSVGYADAEGVLTARRLAGKIDRTAYRDGLAALAALEQRSTGVSPLRMVALDQGSLAELGRLGTGMPELAPATLFAAVSLAHNGATVEDLTRLLGLAPSQALRIVTRTRRSHGV